MNKAMSPNMTAYQLRETFDGVTFIYNGPEQDPVFADPTLLPKEGDIEEYFIWQAGDPPDRYVVMDVDVHDDKIKIFARRTKGDWWKYKIFTTSDGSMPQYKRKSKDTNWSAFKDVTELRIRIDEALEQAHTVDGIEISNGTNAMIHHQGSVCDLVWNPATRKYKLVCH